MLLCRSLNAEKRRLVRPEETERRTGSRMDRRANSDVLFLADEKFDFDVSLSPASSKGDDEDDEDEVFVRPGNREEMCFPVNVPSQLKGGCGERSSWSPLPEDQLEAVCQEAHRLADQLQTSQPQGEDTDTTATMTTIKKEEFVQDPQAKLGMLDPTGRVLSPIKRETFCVQDSPMKQLPPAIQRQLLRRSSSTATSSTRPTATRASSTRPTATRASSTRPTATRATARLSTSSPVAGTKAQPRMSLRGKAALGGAVVLPSKPAAPTVSGSASKSKVEKTRLQQPSKAAVGWKRSPSSCPSSRAESYEDLLSDSASVASDISDCSLNCSQLGKRTLAPPTKQGARGRNLSGIKAPPLQNRRVTDRKNTSSSSSSVSSFNSSLSLSPAKGKLNSSLNRSLSGSTGPAPSSISRPTNHSRLQRSSVHAAADPVSSAVSHRSLSTQPKKLSVAERVKATSSPPMKRVEATPIQGTPAKKLAERPPASIPTITTSSRLQSGLKAKPKPEPLVRPTPSIGGKGVRHADEVSKVLKPQRLMSTSSTDSLLQKPSAGPLTPSASSCKSLQMKARRPSGLPTPLRRRTSAIPAPTPTNLTRTVRQSVVSDSDSTHTPTSARKQHSCSPAPKDTREEEEEETTANDVPDIQPFCLEQEEEPLSAPASNTQQPDQSESVDPGASSQDESAPSKNLIELETTEESNIKTQEVLLLDLPAPTLQPQEKLLIDLTNTPDLIRTNTKTCTTTQLIDLSSPLIKWSPEDKRENSAPLINLSF